MVSLTSNSRTHLPWGSDYIRPLLQLLVCPLGGELSEISNDPISTPIPGCLRQLRAQLTC